MALYEKLKNWWMESRHLRKNDRNLVMTIVAVGIGILLWEAGISRQPSPPTPKDNPNVDTLIPAGYVLYPIAVQNLESLDSIFGSHGIADLFSVTDSGKSVVVARRVKLLRAPLNPSVFAVLIPESQVPQLTAFSGPFFVALQNRNTTPQEGSPPPKQRPKRVQFTVIEENI